MVLPALLWDLAGAAEVNPDAHWPTQITEALRELIHQTNLARDEGSDAIDDTVRNELITRFRHGVLVGLSDTASHGTRPGERKARLLLQVLRDRPLWLRVSGLGAVGGRGLVLVDKLSRTWRTASRLPGGKVVWAVLTVPSRTQARTRSG